MSDNQPLFNPAGVTMVGKLDREHVMAVMAAMVAVKQLSEQTGLRQGVMRCVKCMKGGIEWHVNGKKGHTSGKCSTEGCIQWRE